MAVLRQFCGEVGKSVIGYMDFIFKGFFYRKMHEGFIEGSK